jgi:hypothetical protein
MDTAPGGLGHAVEVMKTDGNRLRHRRMELGLTSRAVANAAKASSGRIKRLEETGDASVLAVLTLTALLEALCLTLSDVVDNPRPPEADGEIVRSVGSFLASQATGVPLADIAEDLGLPLSEVDRAIVVLDVKLRQVGMCIRRSSNGLRLVPAARPEVGTDTPAARSKYLANLNNGDLTLLYKIITSETALHGISQSANTNDEPSEARGCWPHRDADQPAHQAHRARCCHLEVGHAGEPLG